MPRVHRPHLPGHVFHITARTQGGVNWFDPLKPEIASIIQAGVFSAGAILYGFAVMSNHIHVVLVQGSTPLGWIMQPTLRRIALLVHRTFGLQDHVFGRPFFSKVCRDPDQLRHTIKYVHRNPVVAGICLRPDDYEWSSARAWAGLVPCGFVAVEEGLRAFACSRDGSIEELRALYLEQLNSREQSGFTLTAASDSKDPVVAVFASHSIDKPRLPDIHDVVVRLVRARQSEQDLDQIRSRFGGPAIVEFRRQLIATLLHRGYTGVAIARYFRISTTSVSRVRALIRMAILQASAHQRDSVA